jgi:hypothetical protein
MFWLNSLELVLNFYYIGTKPIVPENETTIIVLQSTFPLG